MKVCGLNAMVETPMGCGEVSIMERGGVGWGGAGTIVIGAEGCGEAGTIVIGAGDCGVEGAIIIESGGEGMGWGDASIEIGAIYIPGLIVDAGVEPAASGILSITLVGCVGMTVSRPVPTRAKFVLTSSSDTEPGFKLHL